MYSTVCSSAAHVMLCSLTRHYDWHRVKGRLAVDVGLIVCEQPSVSQWLYFFLLFFDTFSQHV